MKTLSNIIKNLAFASLVLMLSNSLQAAELKKVEADIATPVLKLESLKGEMLDLKDEMGKVVLVQYWATYCTPCRVEMPSMNNLIKKLEAEKV
ncbi:MAG: TlpA family protein disulfide reductase, partial [Thiotrichaceae bacterium]|nr:TlpA family protein disulfide reductase [Thiotrichaceae bacterium]